MKTCKICGESLSMEETYRGTCPDCESAVARLIVKKAEKGLYSLKLRFKL